MLRRTPSRGSESCTGSSSLCVSNPRTVFPHCAAYRAQGKATSGAIMRALTGFAHAGYAALHVRDMLSHGDSDPLHLSSKQVIPDRDEHVTPSGVVGTYNLCDKPCRM